LGAWWAPKVAAAATKAAAALPRAALPRAGCLEGEGKAAASCQGQERTLACSLHASLADPPADQGRPCSSPPGFALPVSTALLRAQLPTFWRMRRVDRSPNGAAGADWKRPTDLRVFSQLADQAVAAWPEVPSTPNQACMCPVPSCSCCQEGAARAVTSSTQPGSKVSAPVRGDAKAQLFNFGSLPQLLQKPTCLQTLWACARCYAQATFKKAGPKVMPVSCCRRIVHSWNSAFKV
jgi:hypothetical protein